MSGRQAQKSYRESLPAPIPAPAPTVPPRSLPPASAELHNFPPPHAPLPAPAALCGPASRWASAATPLNSRTPTAPCIPATVAVSTPATLRCLVHLPAQELHTPPAACPLSPARAPPPPPAATPRALPIPSRSRPVQSGIPGSSPDHPAVPETPGSRLPAISPGLLSDTTALLPSGCTGSAQTAPPLGPAGLHTHAPVPLLLYTVPLLPPPEPTPSPHPLHIPACLRSAALSACSPKALHLLEQYMWLRQRCPLGVRNDSRSDN